MVKHGKCHLDPEILRDIVDSDQPDYEELSSEEIDEFLKDEENECQK